MSASIAPSPLLRLALGLDALASAATGVLLSVGSAHLSGLFGLPQPLLLGAGLVCLAWAAVVGATGRRTSIPTFAVWAIIALNAVWVIQSVLLLVLQWFQPTTLGFVFVIAQAAAVFALAEAQFIGLRRSQASGSAFSA